MLNYINIYYYRNIFGSPKDSPADRMLFTDISEEIITTPGQILDSDQTPVCYSLVLSHNYMKVIVSPTQNSIL